MLNPSTYNQKVMEHFRNPRNIGEGVGYIGNPIFVDIIGLYVKIKDNVITNAKLKTYGCGTAIATSLMVTELVKDRTIEKALTISNQAVSKTLCVLPLVKIHCSVLA